MKKLKSPDMLKINESFNKILQWFFSYPNLPISLSELASELKISKKTATIAVSQLVSEGFLNKEEIGRAWRISCNQQHFYNYTNKVSYNLSLVYSLLYDAGLIKEIYNVVKNPRAIILFGSYRKGDDNDKSDIDIAVEVLGNEDLKIYNLGILPRFGMRKNVPVNLHVFSRNKIDLNLFNNIANGIVLEGFLEVRL